MLTLSPPLTDPLSPPRALVAWDRRLLATSQHLTLLIGTFHGGYPGVDAQGHIISGKGLASGLNFKVGLTRNYKPSKDNHSYRQGEA